VIDEARVNEISGDHSGLVDGGGKSSRAARSVEARYRAAGGADESVIKVLRVTVESSDHPGRVNAGGIAVNSDSPRPRCLTRSGATPTTALVIGSDGALYGATSSGGTGTACAGGCGTVFEVK